MGVALVALAVFVALLLKARMGIVKVKIEFEEFDQLAKDAKACWARDLQNKELLDWNVDELLQTSKEILAKDEHQVLYGTVLKQFTECIQHYKALAQQKSKDEAQIGFWGLEAKRLLGTRNYNALSSHLKVRKGWINTKSNTFIGGTIVHVLAKHRCPEQIIQLLVTLGADFDAQDRFGNTPLLWAIANAENETAMAILTHAAGLDLSKTGWGYAALHLAIAKGYTDKDSSKRPLSVSNAQLVAKLLELGADVNQVCNGLTPLMIACVRRDQAMIKAIEARGPLNRDMGPYSKISYDEAIAFLKKITPKGTFVLDRTAFESP